MRMSQKRRKLSIFAPFFLIFRQFFTCKTNENIVLFICYKISTRRLMPFDLFCVYKKYKGIYVPNI